MTAHATNFQNHQLRKLIAEATGSTDAGSTDVGDIPVCRVRTEIRNRRQRTRYFAADLFSDPAWDILLDLFQGELMQRRISVSSACIGAAVPPTTALRWIASMVKRRMLVRHADPIDGRRVFVELSPDASLAMRLYFANTVRA
jgi:DNA-binding MarR family transcriptional regulator